MTIGIMWLNHHQVMQPDRAASTGVHDRDPRPADVHRVRPVPDAARRRARARLERARDAALAYGFTLTLTAIFFSIVWFYAARGRRLLRDDCDPRVVAGISRSYLPGPCIYLAATLIAFASPRASVILYLPIAAFYIAESSVFGGRADTV